MSVTHAATKNFKGSDLEHNRKHPWCIVGSWLCPAGIVFSCGCDQGLWSFAEVRRIKEYKNWYFLVEKCFG